VQQAMELKNRIETLLDQGKYQDALLELDKETEIFAESRKDDLYLLAEIAGSYITLGSESYNLEAVNKGIIIFQENKDVLKTAVTEDSIDYCLGNGFHAIYKIAKSKESNFFPSPDIVKDSLFDAKQSYLKAFKKIDFDNLNDFSIQILTNLGNNLNHSGRIVEALQLFDMVLKHNPEFPQAIVSKGDGLLYMIQITSCPITVSLFAEMYRLFNKASTQKIVLEEIKKTVEIGKNISAKFLKENSIDLDTIENEFLLNNQEYLNHPENIKFFLDNFLSLSEHGLYCKCNGAKIDDLSIGFPGFVTTDKKIIQLELLNNRVKSEFSLARKLYFDFLTNKQTDNIHYENVLNGVINGIHHEQLRTSFRLCFGILDKIAEGICYLLDLEIKEGENIHFESFWSSNKIPTRWTKINEFKNIHLTALYSIACDLNKKNGEFGFYKIWRNRLEHGLFSITNSDYKYKNWESEKFSEKTPEDNFEIKTKHLLQLTRAAIFSFVFCIRHELITTKENGSS
jgi:tetratricopeptide (TPR) repeat protein